MEDWWSIRDTTVVYHRDLKDALGKEWRTLPSYEAAVKFCKENYTALGLREEE